MATTTTVTLDGEFNKSDVLVHTTLTAEGDVVAKKTLAVGTDVSVSQGSAFAGGKNVTNNGAYSFVWNGNGSQTITNNSPGIFKICTATGADGVFINNDSLKSLIKDTSPDIRPLVNIFTETNTFKGQTSFNLIGSGETLLSKTTVVGGKTVISGAASQNTGIYFKQGVDDSQETTSRIYESDSGKLFLKSNEGVYTESPSTTAETSLTSNKVATVGFVNYRTMNAISTPGVNVHDQQLASTEFVHKTIQAYLDEIFTDSKGSSVIKPDAASLSEPLLTCSAENDYSSEYSDEGAVRLGAASASFGESDNIIASYPSQNEIFEMKLLDYTPENSSWMRQNDWSWIDSKSASQAYRHLHDDVIYGNKKSDIFKGSDGEAVVVNYVLAHDGHKVVVVDDNCAPEIETLKKVLKEKGSAWYYVLDENNKRFQLPHTPASFGSISGTTTKKNGSAFGVYFYVGGETDLEASTVTFKTTLDGMELTIPKYNSQLEVRNGDSVTIPVAKAINGAQFSGWVNENGSYVSSGSIVKVHTDMTFTARFYKQKVVKFIDTWKNKNSVVKSYTIVNGVPYDEYGEEVEEIVFPKAPSHGKSSSKWEDRELSVESFTEAVTEIKNAY